MDTRNDENVSFPRLLTCRDVAEILSVSGFDGAPLGDPGRRSELVQGR